MSAHERAAARLRAYERLLEVVDQHLGPLPSLVNVDPDAVISLVEAHLTEHLPPDVYDARCEEALERVWRLAGEE